MNGIWAMFRKELSQMMRDGSMVMFALFVPVFELILFGVIDMTARDIPTAVWDQSRTEQSRLLISQIENTSYLLVTKQVDSRASLERAIVSGEAGVGIEIPPDYARRLTADRPATVLAMIDGSDSTIASQALAAINGVAVSRSIHELLAAARKNDLPLDVRPVMMFNPDMRSANLLIPGLIAILLTFSGTMLSAFSIVKERERGTLEQLMVTPVSPIGVVLGKILPYLGLAYIELIIVLVLMTTLFRVPINGSVLLLLTLSSVYLLALLSFGILISSRAQSQMEAMQKAMGLTLPAIFLSGYVFPISSLPVPLQIFSKIIPATHFIKIARGIIIRGATFTDLWPNVAALLLISTVLIILSAGAFRKTVS